MNKQTYDFVNHQVLNNSACPGKLKFLVCMLVEQEECFGKAFASWYGATHISNVFAVQLSEYESLKLNQILVRIQKLENPKLHLNMVA